MDRYLSNVSWGRIRQLSSGVRDTEESVSDYDALKRSPVVSGEAGRKMVDDSSKPLGRPIATTVITAHVVPNYYFIIAHFRHSTTLVKKKIQQDLQQSAVIYVCYNHPIRSLPGV